MHYSLAPENKFPTALEECYSVVAHVTSAEHAAKYNVDPTRVALGGDSAGGNLTITTLRKYALYLCRMRMQQDSHRIYQSSLKREN